MRCYSEYGLPTYYDGLYRSAADVMVAFWRLAVMKRLGGSSARPVMNGEEFIKQIDSEFCGIAFYRLETYRAEFKYLNENDWITEHLLTTHQHGFGNDEGYALTERAYQFILAAGQNDLWTCFFEHFCNRPHYRTEEML